MRRGLVVRDPARLSPSLNRDVPQVEAVGVYRPPTSSKGRDWKRLT